MERPSSKQAWEHGLVNVVINSLPSYPMACKFSDALNLSMITLIKCLKNLFGKVQMSEGYIWLVGIKLLDTRRMVVCMSVLLCIKICGASWENCLGSDELKG